MSDSHLPSLPRFAGSPRDVRTILQYLDDFVAVYDTGSVRRAAVLLGVPPQALHRRIQLLERSIGFPVFERVGQHLSLSAAGELLRDAAEEAFSSLEAVGVRLRDRLGTGERATTIASVRGFGTVVRERLARRKRSRIDGLEIVLLPERAVLDYVSTGRAEIGFVYSAARARRLAFTPVGEEELVLIDAPGCVAFAREGDPYAALRRRPCVMYPDAPGTFDAWFEHATRSRRGRLHAGARADDADAVLDLVADGRGWSIVSADLARARLVAGDVEAWHPEGSPCRRPVFVAHRISHAMSAEARRLVRLLRSEKRKGKSEK